jgi:hypothetical protein
MMGLTVSFNDDGTLDEDGTPMMDGTINVKQTGGEEVTFNLDDIERCNLSLGEKRFLREQLRHAAPGPSSCRVPDFVVPDYPPDAES